MFNVEFCETNCITYFMKSGDKVRKYPRNFLKVYSLDCKCIYIIKVVYVNNLIIVYFYRVDLYYNNIYENKYT